MVAHDAHRPLERDGDRLGGSGAVDMKGGVALALGVMRELAAQPDRYAELAVLLVNDEEWRTEPFAHAERWASTPASASRPHERTPGGRRSGDSQAQAALATLRVEAHGRPAHSGSAPHRGRNALLALAHAAQVVASHSDPGGDDRLTAVPTILDSGLQRRPRGRGARV